MMLLTDPQTAILGVFLLSILLLITEKYHRATSAMISAALMVYFGAYVYRIFSPDEIFGFIDWHTLLFIVGVLILVEGLSESGLFQALGLLVARALAGKRNLLFVSFMYLTLAVTLMLANFPAMLIMAAVTSSLREQLGLNLRKWIVYEAVVANSGAIGLMISSIPNLIVALKFGIGFNEFLKVAFPLSFLLTTVTALVGVAAGGLYEGEGKIQIEAKGTLEWKRLIKALMIFSAFLVLVVLNLPQFPIDLVAFLMATLMLWLGGEDPDKIFSNVDWSTVFFLASFYVVIGGVERVGLLEYASTALSDLERNEFYFMTAALWSSGVLSGFVDNIPVALTFTSILKGVTVPKVIPYAIAAGANIGGNLTYFASPPSLVAVSVLEREEGISPMEFTKYSAPLTLIHLLTTELYFLFFPS